jgi:DNA repair protein RecN (Recombination protein N)
VLRQLRITGLGVIEDLDLELDPGLNVLTGETGAGKTMVTVGLSLALGARGNASLVRPGAIAARVQARFDAPEGVDEYAEDGEVILARSVRSDGRSDGRGGARIGGQLTTVSALAELGASLVELHGQHGSLRLLESATQTSFLDRFAGQEHLDAVAANRETFARLRAAREARDRLSEQARDRERELDLLAYQVREIEAVMPTPGESDALVAEEARLGHVERLLELATGAAAALGDDEGAADALAAAARAVAAAAELDPAVEALSVRAAGVAAEAAELARDVRDYGEGLAQDPARLGEVRDRLATLRGLQRKYGATDEDVLAFLTDASQRLRLLGSVDDRVAALDAEVEALGYELDRHAERVTAGRAEAGPRLASAVTEELRDLGMPTARLAVELDRLATLSTTGAERVELRFGATDGQPVLPLAKAASGGELSRVMLACRSVLADLDDVGTLVFDEVDAGIGGEAGLAVGRRLAELATGRQVIVVTHLPQIACFADLHVGVRKVGDAASAERLGDHERVRELSRMLAGLEASDAAADHAEELLAEADRLRRTTTRRHRARSAPRS